MHKTKVSMETLKIHKTPVSTEALKWVQKRSLDLENNNS